MFNEIRPISFTLNVLVGVVCVQLSCRARREKHISHSRCLVFLGWYLNTLNIKIFTDIFSDNTIWTTKICHLSRLRRTLMFIQCNSITSYRFEGASFNFNTSIFARSVLIEEKHLIEQMYTRNQKWTGDGGPVCTHK